MNAVSGVASLHVPECMTSPGGPPCAMGIDEAGRGPVLGPMVYGSCLCAPEMLPKLKACGVADSKKLSAEKRQEIFNRMRSTGYIGWILTVISPEELSAKMLQQSRISLNTISHETAIDLVRQALAKGVNVTELYVDTVGDPRWYQNHLKHHFPNINVRVEVKADSTFPVVSAASIFAKVVRDTCMTTWRFKEPGYEGNYHLGSGYPADPDTKRWMEENVNTVFGYPSIVRFSWKTCATLLADRAAEVSWTNPAEAPLPSDLSQTTLMCSSSHKNEHAPRYRFFSENHLNHARPGLL
ncbi:Ribonuclease H [Pelomyxa schiedti]|nr:Ribonuclease H [Pelomyxa schiedti]